MKKILLFSFFLLLALWQEATAQNRTITGRVTDITNNEGLPGVTVLVKGTQSGTATDASGNYSINVPAGGTTLVFSFIGYTTLERTIGNATTLNVSLSADAQQLNEVVVTALGVEREKRTLGYAAQNVDPQAILTSRETNIVNSLQGKVAGVQINNSGGQAGSSSRIVIRGNTSLTGENQPLFVVDGIPIDNSTNRGLTENTESALFNGLGGNRAIDIDPSIIQNVTVLKGASATALYGSRGANGVILITTKRGEKSVNRKYPRVTLSSSLAYDDAIIDGFQNKYLQGLNGLFRNGLPIGQGGYTENTAANAPTQGSTSWGPHIDSVSQKVLTDLGGRPQIYDPREQFYRTGKVWNHAASVSGGGEKSTYLFSYANLNQEGIVPNNTFKRHSLKAAFTSQISDKVDINSSVNYIASNNQRLPEGNGERSYLYSLNFTPVSYNIERYFELPGNQNPSFSSTGFNNPFWLAQNNGNFSNIDRFIVSNEIGVQLLSWLKLTNRTGLDYYTDELREEVNIGTRSVPNGRMYETLLKRSQINNDLLLTANYDINENLRFTGLIGHNINVRKYNSRTIRGLNLSIPGYFDITNTESVQAYQADEERRLVGLYSSLSLDYKNYLFFNVTGRNDWSSTLPINQNSFFYPSASVGFVFTEILGLANTKYFPYGKIRVSWAQAGNDAPPYYTNQTFSQASPSDGTRGTIIFPFNSRNAFLYSNRLANNQLVHELVTEKEIGGDFRFLNNRVGIDAAYYDKVSKNQILSQEIAGSSGFAERVVNAGEISNKGIELTLTASPVKTSAFSWDVQVNYARNRYKLVSIAEGVDNIFLGGFTSPQIRADKDFGYGVIWGSKLARNENGQVLIDEDGLPVVDDALGAIGNTTPNWTGGLRNTLAYKGLSLAVQFDTRQGGDIFNMDLFYTTYYGTAKATEVRNTNKIWEGVREDGTVNTTPVKQTQTYFMNYYSSVDEFFVEDGSFTKLREVTLSYNLPKALLAKTPFEGVGFSVTGRNLWRKTDFSYGDPEGNLLGNTNAQGFYHAVTPSTKGVTFGVNVRF